MPAYGAIQKAWAFQSQHGIRNSFFTSSFRLPFGLWTGEQARKPKALDARSVFYP